MTDELWAGVRHLHLSNVVPHKAQLHLTFYVTNEYLLTLFYTGTGVSHLSAAREPGLVYVKVCCGLITCCTNEEIL